MPNQEHPAPELPDHESLSKEIPDGQTLNLEFTVEPFVESNPGPHVKAAIAAATDVAGLSTDVGPFGTIVSGPQDQILRTTQEILVAAFDSGASRISLQLTTG